MKLFTSRELYAALGLIGAAPALAQTAASSSPASAVEEIIVTAQKRAENVQDVPISITAVSGDALAKAGVTSLDALQRLAPGLTMSTVGSGYVSYTYIRGGGTNQLDPGSDPSVAFFVDEVYIGGSAGLQFDLFDIERIEVLKGPQGAIFGRNAASGAISVVTKRPSETFGADVAIEYGNYDALLTRGSITGPLTDEGNLLFRLSGSYRQRDGVTENLTGGEDPGNIDSGGARGQLEWRGDDVTLLLAADFLRARNGQTNGFLSSENVSAFLDPTLPALPGQSFYRRYYDLIGYENQDLHDVSGRIDWDTPIGTLTSISAYRRNEFQRLVDNEGTNYDSFNQFTSERTRTFSQELRLAGDAFGDRLRYVAGLFYYQADSLFTFRVDLGPAFSAPVLRGRTAVDDFDLRTDSYAAFGQVTFDLTDRFGVTLGGRYTRDEKKQQRQVDRFGLAAFAVDPELSSDAFTPSVTLDYEPFDDILAYVSYRKGFKSGGFQTVLPGSPAAATTPFRPEKVSSYEAGLKTTLLDRRLQANVALFRSDITDQQVSRVVGIVAGIDNAGETRAEGVDLSVSLKPLPGVTLSADATWQEARFRRYASGGADFAGNAQLRSPDFSGHVAAEYVLPIGNFGDVSLRAEYSRQSEIFFDAANSTLPGLSQSDYGVANLRLTLSPARLPIEVAGFVRNVGDEQYYQNVNISFPTGIAAPGEPRTYGIALSAQF